MSITLHPRLEGKLRAMAKSEGVTVEAYLERLMSEDKVAADDLARLATEGLNSGDPIEVGPDYWNEKHRRLDDQLNRPCTP